MNPTMKIWPVRVEEGEEAEAMATGRRRSPGGRERKRRGRRRERRREVSGTTGDQSMSNKDTEVVVVAVDMEVDTEDMAVVVAEEVEDTEVEAVDGAVVDGRKPTQLLCRSSLCPRFLKLI